jgi:hypothetical protein
VQNYKKNTTSCFLAPPQSLYLGNNNTLRLTGPVCLNFLIKSASESHICNKTTTFVAKENAARDEGEGPAERQDAPLRPRDYYHFNKTKRR